MLGLCHDELRVEATLSIAELVGVHAIAGLEAPNSRAAGHDDSRAVNSRHQRESGSAGLSPRTVPNRGIPDADASRLDRDEHLQRPGPRHWNFVQGQRRRRAESIDRRGFHGVGDVARPSAVRTRDSTMSHSLRKFIGQVVAALLMNPQTIP